MSQKEYHNKPFFLKGANGIGVLLLHGWTAPPDELLPLSKHLNSLGYTISAPLLRGHGTRPEDLFGVTWQDWLKDAQYALEDLKKHTSKIFVGGISMGGDLAMLLSGDKSVAGIISLGTPIRIHFQTIAQIGLFFMGIMKTYRKKYYPPWVLKKMGNRKIYPAYPVENAKEVFRMVEFTEKFLLNISKPILIIQSNSDHIVSNRTPKIIFEGVKSKVKEIFWVENSYHVFVDKKKIWEKIGEFIESVIASAAKQSRDL